MEIVQPPRRETARRWRLLAVAVLAIYWIALFGSTHIPRLPLPTHFNLFDKFCHFVAFAILAVLLNLAWAARRPGMQPPTWREYAKVLLVIAIYGAVDELTQPLVGRSRELLDWLADLTGALLATISFAGFWNLLRRFSVACGERTPEKAMGSPISRAAH